MLEYIIADNPDTRIIKKAAKILENDGIIIIPTDTSWSIVCSITSKEGIERIKHFVEKGRDKPLTVMCSSISQAALLCDISSSAFRIMKALTPGPYVFILPSKNSVAKQFNVKRPELGVRIPKHKVAIEIINHLDCPLLSLTAKRSMIDHSLPAPEYPEEALFSGGWELESINNVDMILDPGEENERLLGTVLDLRNDSVEVLRLGAGTIPQAYLRT